MSFTEKLREKFNNCLYFGLSKESEQKERVMSEIRDCSTKIKQWQQERTKLQETYDYSKAELRALQHERTRLENVKQARLEQVNSLVKCLCAIFDVLICS